jgi:hypothetical protein
MQLMGKKLGKKTVPPTFKVTSSLKRGNTLRTSKAYFPGLTLSYRELRAIRRLKNTVIKKIQYRSSKASLSYQPPICRRSVDPPLLINGKRMQIYDVVFQSRTSLMLSQKNLVSFIKLLDMPLHGPNLQEYCICMVLPGVEKPSTIKVLLDLQLSWFKKMPGTHWFDGYTGQQVLVLEEFQSCFTLTTFLSLCDPYPPQLQVKGGTMPNRSKFIIICSNSNPLQQYERVQLERPQSFAAFLGKLFLNSRSL